MRKIQCLHHINAKFSSLWFMSVVWHVRAAGSGRCPGGFLSEPPPAGQNCSDWSSSNADAECYAVHCSVFKWPPGQLALIVSKLNAPLDNDKLDTGGSIQSYTKPYLTPAEFPSAFPI